MKQSTKKILSILFIMLSIGVVFFIAFSNTELKDAWKALGSLNPLWLAGVFLCWVAYVFFDAFGTWRCLRRQGFVISLGNVIIINLVGLYYSNITPGASGGQPMQVNSLRKAGIPVGNGTSAVTIRLITNQFMVSVLSLVFFLLNRSYVYEQLEGAIWFVRIGWLINFSVVPLVLLAAFRKDWVSKLAGWLISLLCKMRLIRDREKMQQRVTAVLDTYHTAVLALLRSPGQILLQCLYSGLSYMALAACIIFVYHAFGLSGVPWYRLQTISLLLFISASYTPLPGAAGAQEGGFLFYFRNIFTGGTVGVALLVWRFFTYYLSIFIGVIMLLLEKLTIRRENRKLPEDSSTETAAETATETAAEPPAEPAAENTEPLP